jgi:hypothetical protein
MVGDSPVPSFTYGEPPYTTPGTRLAWSTGLEWLDALERIRRRRISAKRYQDERAHLDELARRPYFIKQQIPAVLELMRARVKAAYRPVAGARAGTSYERVINEINNAIARKA